MDGKRTIVDIANATNLSDITQRIKIGDELFGDSLRITNGNGIRFMHVICYAYDDNTSTASFLGDAVVLASGVEYELRWFRITGSTIIDIYYDKYDGTIGSLTNIIPNQFAGLRAILYT